MTVIQLVAHHATQLHPLATQARALVAATPQPASGTGTPSDLDGAVTNLKAAINHLLTYFLPIGLLLCALYYAWGGLHWIAAGSSPRLVDKARTIWWHATVGLVGVIMATPAVNTLKSFFGL
jgi:hypothetical protein